MPQMLRAKVAGSGALLLIAAGLHGADLQRVTEAVAALPPDLAAMTRGLWLFFSWHLAVLGLAALAGAGSGWPMLRSVLFFCGLVAAGDFLWVFALTGWGVDTVLMLLAALGLLVGGAFWRPPREPAAGSGGESDDRRAR